MSCPQCGYGGERLEALERYAALDEIVEDEIPLSERIDEVH